MVIETLIILAAIAASTYHIIKYKTRVYVTIPPVSPTGGHPLDRMPVQFSSNLEPDPELPTLTDDGPSLALATIDDIAAECKRRDISFLFLYHIRREDRYKFFYSNSMDARNLIVTWLDQHRPDNFQNVEDLG